MENHEVLVQGSQNLEIPKNLAKFTYHESEFLKKEAIWKNLADIPLSLALVEWLSHLSAWTRKNYTSGINVLKALRLIDVSQSLQAFAMVNHDRVVDDIKKIPGISEATAQARAALYISLTRFLSRRTEGIIKRAIPCREGTIATTKTFGAVRDKVKSEALNREEWGNLIDIIELRSKRDALIVKLCLQGAKRIREVLDLKINKVDFERCQVTFKQSKTKGVAQEIIVNIPEHLSDELKNYIGPRKEGYVFITSSGRPVTYIHIYEVMKRAAKNAKISKNVHPHVLRASAITFHRSRGVRDCEIMRLTGHSSAEMINKYDKASMEENASRVSLV